jgi:hypothetical protein
LEDLQWSKAIFEWAWKDDLRLQEDGTIYNAIGENHNRFGANLSKAKISTICYKHWIGKANPSFKCSNLRLERRIGDNRRYNWANQFKFHLSKCIIGSKGHFTNQCVYFAFRTIILFGVILSKIHVFIKRNISNEIFWNFIIILFIVAPICHMFFYNQFWMNMNLWKCTNFVRFCVSFWKIVTISNHTKTFNIFKFNFLYYKLQKKIKQHKNCITSTFLKELMNFFKPLNFDKHKSEKIWKYACFLDVFNGTLLLWKTKDQRNFIMKTKKAPCESSII